MVVWYHKDTLKRQTMYISIINNEGFLTLVYIIAHAAGGGIVTKSGNISLWKNRVIVKSGQGDKIINMIQSGKAIGK